jgi:ABC-type transport system substrate-binding protein
MALEVGEVDVIQFVPEEEVARLDAHPEITVLTTPAVRTHFLVFNTEAEPFDNIIVRQAVDYAIDQGALVEHIWMVLVCQPEGQYRRQYTGLFMTNYQNLCMIQRKPEPYWQRPGGKILMVMVCWIKMESHSVLPYY